MAPHVAGVLSHQQHVQRQNLRMLRAVYVYHVTVANFTYVIAKCKRATMSVSSVNGAIEQRGDHVSGHMLHNILH